MGHFGQELRRERESRGIALETITGETKISGRHLLSLEEGQFDALPGGVLSKGIVRGYARVVGIDEEDCIRRYLAACRQSGLEQEEDAGWTEFAANVGRNRKGEFEGRTGLQWAGVALLLTLLAVFGWYVAHFVQGRVSQAVFSPTPMTAVAAPGPASTPPPSAAAAASGRVNTVQANMIELPADKSTAVQSKLQSGSAEPSSTGTSSVKPGPVRSIPAESASTDAAEPNPPTAL